MNFTPLIKLARPKQWIKNLLVFFPPFLSGALLHPDVFSKGFVPYLAFCFASSTAYIFNDLLDLNYDTLHPTKKMRPIASGDVSIGTAKVELFILLSTALLLGWLVSPLFLLYLASYLAISVAYSLYLKHLPIFDIFCISLGFILRLYGGGEAFRVAISDWLFLTVFLLAIFLSVGKRYSEQRLLGNAAGTHRQTLAAYPRGFLEGTMYMSGAAVLVTYALYAIIHPPMVYSVPLCLFGLLRYQMRIKCGANGDPTESLIKDFPLLVTGLLWVCFVGWSIYR